MPPAPEPRPRVAPPIHEVRRLLARYRRPAARPGSRAERRASPPASYGGAADSVKVKTRE